MVFIIIMAVINFEIMIIVNDVMVCDGMNGFVIVFVIDGVGFFIY